MNNPLLEVIPESLQAQFAIHQSRLWHSLVAQNPMISSVTLNSQAVQSGALFVALPGHRLDGRDFIPDAIAAGAALVLAESADAQKRHHDLQNQSTKILWVMGLRSRLAEIAKLFYQIPWSAFKVFGVTGTNGKTSITYFIAQALAASELRQDQVGLLGTLGTGKLEKLTPSVNTTADVLSVHRTLAEMYGSGLTVAAMEVSSHALDQGRVQGVHFHAGVFANLSHDHLDYHQSFEAYGEAKVRLFREYLLGHGIFNLSDPYVARVCETLSPDLTARGISVWGYHLEPSPKPQLPEGQQIWLVSLDHQDEKGLSFTAMVKHQPLSFTVPLIGTFNLENTLAVISVLVTLGMQGEDLVNALKNIRPPPGRMQCLHQSACAKVVIDYAHTPDALIKALAALRPLCSGQLWCVFGCGGDRDRQKRRLMGAAAVAGADRLVLTSDNPRSEDPAAIIEDVLQGITSVQRSKVCVEVDREQAIRIALKQSTLEDWILVAGKGHENYQLIQGERLVFSDQAIVESYWR